MAATVWKGYLSFGLVSFPVRLFSAARPETVHFHMLHKKDFSRIKEVWYCAEENKPVDRSEIVKGYEYADDKYVVVDEEELEKIAPPTAKTMDILQFVKASEVDPVFFETSYYIVPDEEIGKPYVLFMNALEQTGYDAIAKVSMHNREHTVIIRVSDHGLVLHTLYYTDELHKANAPKLPKKDQVSAQEMELAKRLIADLAAPFKPEQYHDQFRENVEHLIEQKQKGEAITPTKAPKKQAPVVNILDALKASLAKAPARPEAQRTPKKTSRKRRSAA